MITLLITAVAPAADLDAALGFGAGYAASLPPLANTNAVLREAGFAPLTVAHGLTLGGGVFVRDPHGATVGVWSIELPTASTHNGATGVRFAAPLLALGAARTLARTDAFYLALGADFGVSGWRLLVDEGGGYAKVVKASTSQLGLFVDTGVLPGWDGDGGVWVDLRGGYRLGFGDDQQVSGLATALGTSTHDGFDAAGGVFVEATVRAWFHPEPD